MEYTFTYGEPITEAEALAEAAALGFHAFAFDLVVDGTPPVSTAPTADELALLRTRVDLRRTLQKKFP